MTVENWLPLIAAIISGAIAIVGVWWSIGAANRRDRRRWKQDRTADAVVNFLAASQEVTDYIDRYVEDHSKVVKKIDKVAKETGAEGGLPDANPEDLPDRFEAMRRVSALSPALSMLWLVASPAIYRAASDVRDAHNVVVRNLHATDSTYSSDFDGWTATNGSTKPRDILWSAVVGILTFQRRVAHMEDQFMTKVRSEMELPAFRPREDGVSATSTYYAPGADPTGEESRPDGRPEPSTSALDA